MIFTRRFGALAARPTFERVTYQHDLDRELPELPETDDVDLEFAALELELEPAGSHRAH